MLYLVLSPTSTYYIPVFLLEKATPGCDGWNIYWTHLGRTSPLESIILRIQWRLIFAIVISCYRIRLWVGYFNYFEITHVFFRWMFFNSVKKINRLRKEISRLVIKWRSAKYLLKSYYWHVLRTSIFWV